MTLTTSAKPAPHLPGEVGIWVFILGDMLIFGLLFCTFIYYRADAPELFQHSQDSLNRNFGALNTILLLSSSWLVAMSVQSARRELWPRLPWLLGGAFVCGLGFIVVKFFEYSEKIEHGITLTTNDFFMYYYVLTGLHLMHLILGMGVLAFLWSKSRQPQAPISLATLESGASFWHLIDLLWIVLFPLIYLIH